MSSKAVLLVLAVSEPGLRSALAAQLTLAGVDIVTAHEVDGPTLRRSIRRPAILILDEHVIVARSAEWLDALLSEPYWRQILVLCERVTSTNGNDRDPRLLYLTQSEARSEIGKLIPQWVAEER